MIGGNTIALIQVKDKGAKNVIGERIHQWINVASPTGWLDLISGDSKYTPFNAKVQESSHVFLCDHAKLDGVTSENARILIDGFVYDVMLIDDTMNLHQQLEIYLKYVGGQDA